MAWIVGLSVKRGSTVPVGLVVPLGASRRSRSGELLESCGKARSNLTTAAAHGERCYRGALRLARTTGSRLTGLECAVHQPCMRAQVHSYEDNK
jgi:hypothetical protein